MGTFSSLEFVRSCTKSEEYSVKTTLSSLFNFLQPSLFSSFISFFAFPHCWCNEIWKEGKTCCFIQKQYEKALCCKEFRAILLVLYIFFFSFLYQLFQSIFLFIVYFWTQYIVFFYYYSLTYFALYTLFSEIVLYTVEKYIYFLISYLPFFQLQYVSFPSCHFFTVYIAMKNWREEFKIRNT